MDFNNLVFLYHKYLYMTNTTQPSLNYFYLKYLYYLNTTK